MSTMTVLFAIWGLVPTSATGEPVWVREYNLARQRGEKEVKPLAVFVGSGKSGWDKVSRDGRLGGDVRRLLAESYVCLYVDTSDQKGQKLASALEISAGPGLVISSRAGNIQAFRHEGGLDNDDLERYLKRYADPEFTVRVTETGRQERTSYYPSESSGYEYRPTSYPSRGGC